MGWCDVSSGTVTTLEAFIPVNDYDFLFIKGRLLKFLFTLTLRQLKAVVPSPGSHFSLLTLMRQKHAACYVTEKRERSVNSSALKKSF